MIKKLKPIILLLSIQLSSCAVLVKETDLKDYDSTMKLAKETVSSSKIKPNKIKNLAFFGFNSNLFSGESSNSSIMGVNTGLISAISDANIKRGCIALDKTYDIATKTLKEYGFNILSADKLSNSQTYMNLGMKDFPGLCTSGKTRFNILPPEKEMNILFDELGVDALVSFSINAENDVSNNASMYVWTKGSEKAELAWTANLGRQIKIESDTNIFFSDLQDLSRSNEQKIAITARVYITAFKLLAIKMAEEFSNK